MHPRYYWTAFYHKQEQALQVYYDSLVFQINDFDENSYFKYKRVVLVYNSYRAIEYKFKTKKHKGLLIRSILGLYASAANNLKTL